MSSSVLLLSFDGRRTGRRISLPLRYLKNDVGLVCFTTDNATWWRNFEEPYPVDVLVVGKTLSGLASTERVTTGEPLEALRLFLSKFPADAAYHHVSVVDGIPSEADLTSTSIRSVRVQIVWTRLSSTEGSWKNRVPFSTG
ncbi:MAG: hypothetical protein O7E57_08995 [Gammaproteobacteria bacterium]|nr:hypothetical protein [Gammaproteobacteria bacterium]